MVKKLTLHFSETCLDRSPSKQEKVAHSVFAFRNPGSSNLQKIAKEPVIRLL